MDKTIDFESILDQIRIDHPEIETWLNEKDIYFCANCGKLIDCNWRGVEEVNADPYDCCCSPECAEKYFEI